MEYHQQDGTGSLFPMSGRIHISSRTTFIVNMVLPRQHTSHCKAVSCNNLLDIVHAFWSQTLELHTTL